LIIFAINLSFDYTPFSKKAYRGLANRPVGKPSLGILVGFMGLADRLGKLPSCLSRKTVPGGGCRVLADRLGNLLAGTCHSV